MIHKLPSFEGIRRRPRHEPRWRAYGRRIVTVSLYLLAWTILAVGLPVWLLLAVGVGAFRDANWVAARVVLFFLTYFTFELIGAGCCFGIWLASGVWMGGDRRRYYRWNFWMQRWWVAGLTSTLVRIFDVKVKLEGDTDFGRHKFILFQHHASAVDTIFTPYFCFAQGVHLRIVVKRELLWDPALDCSFNSLPNCFVTRGAADPEKQIEAVAQLVDDLGDGEGIFIYPEGTRFTKEKHARILKKIEDLGDHDALARAKKLRMTLPPRPGGPLALLDRNTDADAMFCTHVGVEKTTSFADLWNGAVVGQTFRFKFWRVPFEEIPKTREERMVWLSEHWQRVDDFIVENTDVELQE